MDIRRSLKWLKHHWSSYKCMNCYTPLDNISFDIESAKIVCPICNFKNDPEDIYPDVEIINLASYLIPDDQDVFLNKLGFHKKPVRRTSKFSLVFIIIIMSVGMLLSVSSMDINIYLKMLLIPILVVLTVKQLLRYYRNEEKPKWYRK